MPKLILLAPAQMITVDRETSLMSLMSILVGLDAQVTAEVPVNAISPMNWQVATLYFREEGDADKEFDQRIRVFTPDRVPIIESATIFRMVSETHGVIAKIPGFPVGRSGVCTIEVEIKEHKEDTEWRKVGEYPLRLTHKTS